MLQTCTVRTVLQTLIGGIMLQMYCRANAADTVRIMLQTLLL